VYPGQTEPIYRLPSGFVRNAPVLFPLSKVGYLGRSKHIDIDGWKADLRITLNLRVGNVNGRIKDGNIVSATIMETLKEPVACLVIKSDWLIFKVPVP
jgi:hypothetical protein